MVLGFRKVWFTQHAAEEDDGTRDFRIGCVLRFKCANATRSSHAAEQVSVATRQDRRCIREVGRPFVHRHGNPALGILLSASEFSYSISIETQNQTGAVLAVYLSIRKGKTKVTREYANGDVFADYDSQGQLLGIEILAPCRAAVLDRIAKRCARRSDSFAT